MIAKEIINLLEINYPRNNAEEWDNVGLLIGDRKKEIKKVQISLDATEDVIDFAIANDVDVIVTHHPMIFKGIKNIDYSTVLGRKIIKLIKKDIVLYAAHTNLDSSKEGLNYFVAQILGAKESKIVDLQDDKVDVGIGRLFSLEKELTVAEYVKIIKEKFNIENVRVITKNEDIKVRKIAVVNGSGMSYWRKVKSLGADLFITGDIGYHEALDAKENNMNLIDIGHFESEICFVELIKKVLSDCDVEIIVFNDGPVFKIY